MIVLLNGPLGIGKSTLAEALMERLSGCVMLDGDHMIAVNPSPPDEVEYLHRTLALLVQHHQSSGYHHFVINHIWRTPAELDDLRRKLNDIAPEQDIRCFLLVLPLKENLRRIQVRQGARAMEEQEWEQITVLEERSILRDGARKGLGERFEVAASPEQLATELLSRLDIV